MPDETRTWLRIRVLRDYLESGGEVTDQQIFSWSFTEDHWASFPDPDVRMRFEDRMMLEFSPQAPKCSRTAPRFEDFINDVEVGLAQMTSGSNRCRGLEAVMYFAA